MVSTTRHASFCGSRVIRRYQLAGKFLLLLLILSAVSISAGFPRGCATSRHAGPRLDNEDVSLDRSAVEESAPSVKIGSNSAGNPHGRGIYTDTFAPEPIALKDALVRIAGLLPSAMESRDLLREMEGSGATKLREIGLRARQYKTFLNAWEEAHVLDSHGGTFIVTSGVTRRLGKDKRNISEAAAGSFSRILHRYDEYRAFLAQFAQLLFPWTNPFFADHMTLHAHLKNGGRGIVFTAGDQQAPFLLTAVAALRHLGCTLPVEVMYLGDDDLREDYRLELERFDRVVTRDLSQMVHDKGWRLRGWAAKPFAILFSSFREAIFIDADSLFFSDPERLFDDPAYVDTGALFFKDRLVQPESKREWLKQLLPDPISLGVLQSRLWTGQSAHMQESGVVVVDKWRHFIALLVVCRLNGPERDSDQSEGKVGVYDMIYGDKETFWLGWELAGSTEYAFHPGAVAAMGVLQGSYTSDGQIQRETDKENAPRETFEAAVPRGATTASSTEATASTPYNAATESSDAVRRMICSPQLLHLGRQGKPLWFNGWLLENKFAPREAQRFSQFRHYAMEPESPTHSSAWVIGSSNNCCLTFDFASARSFDEGERKLLEFMTQHASQVV